MKTDSYRKRFYREWVDSKGLFLARISVKETDLQILTDKKTDEGYLYEKVGFYRRQIEKYITKDNRFLTSLKPISVDLRAPRIIKEMSSAAAKANVGPMAAVAGAIAQALGKDLVRKGYKDVIIENGGDIFLKTTRICSVGIYAGSSAFKRIYLKIKPLDTPIGVCTSSGTVGHSLSFGLADSVIILSKDAALADAVATATGNLVKSRNDLKDALDFAKSVKKVSGVSIIVKNKMISWGKIEFAKRGD